MKPAELIKVSINRPDDGAFVLGASFLDEALLGDGTDTIDDYVEADVLGLSISYGCDFSPPFAETKLRGGVETITFRSDTVDPSKTSWIRPGAPVTVTASSTTLFYGRISNIQTIYQKTTAPLVTLTVEDQVSSLSGAPLDAFLSVQSASARIKSLSPLIVINSSSTTNWRNLAPLVSGYTALEVLEMAINTEDGSCSSDRLGKIQVYNRGSHFSKGISATFTDNGTEVNHSASVLSYSDITATFSMDQVVNVLTIANKSTVALNEIVTNYGPFINQYSIDVWGSRTQDITMNSAIGIQNINAFGAAEMAEVEHINPVIRISKLTYRVNASDSSHVLLASTLTTMNKIRIKYSTESVSIDDNYIITSVEHDITPDDWVITYGVMAQGSLQEAN